MPMERPTKPLLDDYDIYPYHPIGDGKISAGYGSLAEWMVRQKTVLIDGYIGVWWNGIEKHLHREFERQGVSVRWHRTADFFKDELEIDEQAAPFLGDAESVWGTKTTLQLTDFFRHEALKSIHPDTTCDVNIVIGIGAALVGWEAALVYIDFPKNELQHRMNAGAISNLGKRNPDEPKIMYKRFYFVDWVVLNEHKEQVLDRIAVIADGQWDQEITWGLSTAVLSGLEKLAKSVFRVRPWFSPGAWGGQWMKRRFPGMSQQEVNYAWSFELIAPENGIVLESDGYLLEVSFDFLMYWASADVLGRHAERFQNVFPIRFDFLDTFDGGNLSIQCHPSLQYIQEQFGEEITQDETYYILDCKENAKVYLGFQENIDPEQFKSELEESVRAGQAVTIEKYVQAHPSGKHDLFLIPNGTVHSAGANNLVLEISATPYIFTFKMYDWLRMDLDGQPRPINIEHAFNNLKFDRKGESVTRELLSKPYVLNHGKDWAVYHLPTHQEHFYDVYRMEFQTDVTVATDNVCHVLMLVEGSSVVVQTADGTTATFHYAETFVIPAAAGSYTLTNKGGAMAKVVKAFIKY